MKDNSTTVKVAIISAVSAVVIALITGLFSLFTVTSESKKTVGNCSPIISGKIYGGYNSECT